MCNNKMDILANMYGLNNLFLDRLKKAKKIKANMDNPKNFAVNTEKGIGLYIDAQVSINAFIGSIIKVIIF